MFWMMDILPLKELIMIPVYLNLAVLLISGLLFVLTLFLKQDK
jgi:hypothetical protein